MGQCFTKTVLILDTRNTINNKTDTNEEEYDIDSMLNDNDINPGSISKE